MKDYKSLVLQKTQKYMKKCVPGYGIRLNCNIPYHTCPSCGEKACTIHTATNYTIDCNACNWTGNIVDVVRLVFPEHKNKSEDEIYKLAAIELGVSIVTEEDIINIFKMYKRLGFDMVPVRRQLKIPFETEWQKKSHREIQEWEGWLVDDLNIGIKTGHMSQVTVIDVDCKNLPKGLPDELKPYLSNVDTLVQETNRGFHFFFQYEKDLPKTGFDIVVDPKEKKRYHIDIENDGGQVVAFPSEVVDDETGELGFDRKFNVDRTKLHSISIAKMPDGLKKLILSKIDKSKITVTDTKNPIDNIDTSNLEDFMKIDEGNRNNALMHLGGIFRKELGPLETEKIIGIVNRYFVNPPLNKRELQDNIFRPLRKYIKVDENELAKKILDYMRIVGEASATDIRTAINHNKYDCDKATELLVREGHLFKKRKCYHLIRKAEWSDKWGSEGEPVGYDVPYFHDRVNFRSGDMIIVGAKTGVGKTHVAMNIIKKLVDQGKKPYYISLESGSRFVSIAKGLKMGEGDFYHTTLFAPEDVELENDAITIIDWLLPEDYSQTDKLYKYFAEQLTKKGGILIVFVQLKESKEQESRFFAENMIKMFPALVVKFGYHKDSKGNETPERSYFESVKIRDPKNHSHRFKMDLKYIPDLKTLEIE